MNRFAPAPAIGAVLAAILWVCGPLPRSQEDSTTQTAGFLGIPTDRVDARDAAAEELLSAELDAHIATLEYGAQVRLRRLSAVMNELSADGFICVPARVEDVDMATDRRRLIVSAGYAQGVPENSVAVSFFRSLAGLVVNVESERSEVLLITDPASAVPAMVHGGTGATPSSGTAGRPDSRAEPTDETVRGAVLGGQGNVRSGPELLRFTYIEGPGTVRPDQLLTTSGEGDLYPPGLPIGRVVGSPVTMERLTPPYADVRPIAKLGALREVIITWRGPGVGEAE